MWLIKWNPPLLSTRQCITCEIPIERAFCMSRGEESVYIPPRLIDQASWIYAFSSNDFARKRERTTQADLPRCIPSFSLYFPHVWVHYDVEQQREICMELYKMQCTPFPSCESTARMQYGQDCVAFWLAPNRSNQLLPRGITRKCFWRTNWTNS